jgi:formate-dependent phosphoribosylglycinamide formyltransferase (GAR transformylase)
MPGALTLAEIAKRLGGRVAGDSGARVSQVGSLENAAAGEITFVASPKHRAKLAETRASAVILSDQESEHFSYDGIAEALAVGAPRKPVDLRIFAKPKTLSHRRMGVALARAENVEEAVERAKAAAARVQIRY